MLLFATVILIWRTKWPAAATQRSKHGAHVLSQLNRRGIKLMPSRPLSCTWIKQEF
jgi:hypothetical protein